MNKLEVGDVEIVEFLETELEDIREGHFPEVPIIPGVAQIEKGMQVLGMEHYQDGDAIVWKFPEGDSQAGPALLTDNAMFVISPEEDEQGTLRFISVYGGNEVTNSVISRKTEEDLKYKDFFSVLKPLAEKTEVKYASKEALPHRGKWNLVNPKTSIRTVGNKAEGIRGRFDADLRSPKIREHLKNGKLSPIILMEFLGQQIASFTLNDAEIPTFQEIDFCFHKGAHEISLEDLDEVGVYFEVRREKRKIEMKAVFNTPGTSGAVIYSGGFSANALSEKLFRKAMDSARKKAEGGEKEVSATRSGITTAVEKATK